MNEFVKDHPWMTFILGIVALDSVAYIIRGPKVVETHSTGASFGPSTSHGKLLPWLNPAAYYRS